MNLHNIVTKHINKINRETNIIIHKFKESIITDFGENINIYDIIETKAQIQPINSEKLQHINNFNSSNTYRRLFLNGKQDSLSLNTNGDLIEFDNKLWLIIESPQSWDCSGWNEIVVCLQV